MFTHFIDFKVPTMVPSGNDISTLFSIIHVTLSNQQIETAKFAIDFPGYSLCNNRGSAYIGQTIRVMGDKDTIAKIKLNKKIMSMAHEREISVHSDTIPDDHAYVSVVRRRDIEKIKKVTDYRVDINVPYVMYKSQHKNVSMWIYRFEQETLTENKDLLNSFGLSSRTNPVAIPSFKVGA